jgi:hypothetical protein
MTRFKLKRPVDAAICMQDSQGHLLTNDALLGHLRCVARSLKKGGLYVFDRYMCSSWTDPARRWSWTRRRGRATVRATFEALKDLNPVTQTFYEDMELEAHEDGVRRVYRQRHASRMVFPQELRALVQLAGGFDLVEWFYGFKPHLRLDQAHHPLRSTSSKRPGAISAAASTAPAPLSFAASSRAPTSRSTPRSSTAGSRRRGNTAGRPDSQVRPIGSAGARPTGCPGWWWTATGR